jgi:hypothetical protein
MMSQGQGCHQQMVTTHTALDLSRSMMHVIVRIVSGHAQCMRSDFKSCVLKHFLVIDKHAGVEVTLQN